jgi:hypothetical protein
MKSVGQLIYEIDTIDLQRDKMLERNLYDFRKIARHKPLDLQEDTDRSPIPVEQVQDVIRRDSIIDIRVEAEEPTEEELKPVPKLKRGTARQPVVKLTQLEILLDSVPSGTSWDSLFTALPVGEREQYIKQGLSVVRTLHQSNQRLLASLKSVRIGRAKHVYELHSKFCFAVICIIFLFIGAPMGAIVRKGGFGYPLLVAVIFFTIFILLTLMFKKLSEAESVDPTLGAWMPCIVLFPMSLILTYTALNDAKMVNIDPMVQSVVRSWNWLRRKSGLGV